MSQVTHSPFLQALGYAIINSLWQFALLWLIYVSIHTFLKLSSHQKYTTGLLIQAAGFIWFAATFSFYLRQFTRLEEAYILQHKDFSMSVADSDTSTAGEKFFAAIMQTESFLPYLSVAYLLILVFLCLKLLRVYHLTRTVKTRGLKKIDVDWRLFVKRLSCQLGIKREVKIYLSEMVATPLTIGFFKPFILIPLSSLNHLNSYQMEAVILHELAHIKRFDYLFNLFLALIDITLFFNPFTVLISKHIKRERENCCDDWVLQYEYNAASYASALLQIATCPSSSLLALQASDDKHILLNRIKRMMEKKEKSFFNYRYQLMALVVMLTIVSSLALLSSWHNINKAAVSPLTRQVVVKPMNEIVNSPLYNPDFFIAPDIEKATHNKKSLPEKTTIKNFQTNTSLIRRPSTGTNIETGTKKMNTKFLTAKANRPKLFAKSDEPLAENLEENPEILAINLDEVAIAENVVKERLALTEGQLQQLALHLFEQNKAATINHKQVFAQIKAAFDQIKLVKIQLELARQKVLASNKKIKNIKENELRMISRFAPFDIDKLQRIVTDLQMQTEPAEKQPGRASQRNFRFYNHNYNNNYKAPKVIFRLPLQEKPHLFSFEFLAEPKAKVDAPSSFYTPKKVKNTNKRSLKETHKNFKPGNLSPFILNKSLQNDQIGEDDLLIIKI